MAVECPSVPDWACRPGVQVESATVRDAVDLPADQLSVAVADAYADVLARAARGGRRPVRFWNFLPGINDPVGDDGQTRYMAFNAGRMAAFGARPAARVATASAVGHGGRDLLVHCLPLVADDAVPIDNPRQVRPGPLLRPLRPPPAVLRPGHPLGLNLFIGGTASVRGEDSVHPGDLPPTGH